MSKTSLLNGTAKVVENADKKSERARMSQQWAILWLYYANVSQKTCVDGNEYNFSKLKMSAEALRMNEYTEQWLREKHIALFSTPTKVGLNGSNTGSRKIEQIDIDKVIALAQMIAEHADKHTEEQIRRVQKTFVGYYRQVYNTQRTISSDFSELDSFIKHEDTREIEK